MRALEDRPLTVSTLVGSVAEIFNLVAPRLSDAVLSLVDRAVPDSPQARAHVVEAEGQTRTPSGSAKTTTLLV